MNIKARVLKETEIILKTKRTIREIAKLSKVSKSTVHADLTIKLLKINKNLYLKVQEILNFHKEIRHLNGGMATKEKYRIIKNQNIV